MAKKKLLKTKPLAKSLIKSVNSISDEEMAFRMVKLYFEEVARMGFKRTLDLDAIINAYFYSLVRMKRKNTEMNLIKEKVLKEESELIEETKKELFPNPTE